MDDEPEIRQTMQSVIENHFGTKARVIQAENGLEATSKINCQVFDCIITDLNMPKKEGEAFISSVRQNTFNGSTPVIILSGIEKGKRVAEHFKFVYFIAKPCQFDQVTKLLEVQLNVGKTNRRVSADLLNNFLNATKNQVKKTTGLEANLFESIKSKNATELIIDNYVATLEISIGSATNYFSLFFDQENLAKLYSLNSNNSVTQNNDVENDFCYSLLHRVVRREKQCTRKSVKANLADQNFLLFQKKSGILIDVGNELLNFSVFSSSK